MNRVSSKKVTATSYEQVAALLHRAADMDHKPTIKETKFLLPKPALSARDIKPPQWVNMVRTFRAFES